MYLMNIFTPERIVSLKVWNEPQFLQTKAKFQKRHTPTIFNEYY